MMMPLLKLSLVVPAALALAGCAIHPKGEKEEREKIESAGVPYTRRAEPPLLPEKPGPDDYLRHAFLSNADLEARYWEWKAAIEQVPQDASLPNAAISFDSMFSGGAMKAWDRTTLGISNEPMSMIPFPTKLAAAGRRALEAARAAGLRFEAAKFALQGNVLSAYHDLALLAESIRIGEENVALLGLIVGQAEARVGAGTSSQQDLLAAQTELDLARNDLENLRSRVPPAAARLNALVGRPADAPVPLPDALPEPRPLPLSDADLIRLGSERSPELSALAREVAGREVALSLARQAYIPDIGLSFSFTGSISQTVGGMLTIPIRLEAIRAGVEQARAGLRAAQAARTQYKRDLAASFVLNLYTLRNDERQVSLFEGMILPRTRQAVDLARTAFAVGRIPFLELLEAQRTLLDVRLALAQIRTEREKALAAIETWSAVDVEAMRPGPARSRGGMTSARPAGGKM
jgi:cobalt-zinc-cadmium efflux system outer membrane protein